MEINGIVIEINDRNFSSWIERFNRLLEFYQRNIYGGEIIYYQQDGITIGFNKLKLKMWIKEFKELIDSYQKYGSLNFPIYYELNKITINSDKKRQKNWIENFGVLLQHYKMYGNIDILPSYELNEIKIGRWLKSQKKAIKKTEMNKISKIQIEILDIFGLKLDKLKENWYRNYNVLKEYYKKYGNTDVPCSYMAGDFYLRNWLDKQRAAFAKGKLDEYKIKLLDDLKIKWNVKEETWHYNYEFLKEYYVRYGNIDVPFYYQIADIELGSWLDKQRKAYEGKKTLKISKEHVKLLNDLNIDWNPKNTKILNATITDENVGKYNQILEERLNYVLEDLIYEGMNSFNDYESEQKIENTIIKRLWR